MDYKFTNQWFLGNVYGRGEEIDIRSIWTALFAKHPIEHVLEIGSYEGQSSCFLGEHLGSLGRGSITCIDTWQGSMEHGGDAMGSVEARFDDNIAVLRNKIGPDIEVRKLKDKSINGAARLLTEGKTGFFDFIYIDRSHRSADVLSDAVITFQLLKPGGLMVFDDYLWNYGYLKTGDVLESPKQGIDAFINTFSGQLEVLHGYPSYQLYAHKISRTDKMDEIGMSPEQI